MQKPTNRELLIKILRARNIQSAIKNFSEGKLYSDTCINNIIKIEQFNND